MNEKYDIFISYRRLDDQGKISGRDQARLIAKQLELDGYHPFFDYSEIKDNEFDNVILPAIKNSRIFILVLSKDALNRCSNADDWVRREIETAIATGSKIINVSPDNNFNGWPNTLPESISAIKRIQISEIHFGSLFELSIKKLIDERILPGIQNIKIEENTQNFQQTDIDEEFVDFIEDILGEQNNPEELYQKGLALFHGKGVEKDRYTAVMYYEKAAKIGHPKAQRLLYGCYLHGIGVKENNEKAMYWLEKSASNQDFFAMYTMAELFREKKSYKQAYEYYKNIIDTYETLCPTPNMPNNESECTKSERYYLSSVINIGGFYENGLYLKKDYEQAKIWYRKAKELGEKEPLINLLDKIKAEANEGIVDDLPNLLSYEEKYELAQRYLFGLGLDQSFEKALPLLKECAQNGIYLAYKDLGLGYAKGRICTRNIPGTIQNMIEWKKDVSLGFQYLNKCANLIEDGEVYFELGMLYELGMGTHHDNAKALYWYKRAVNQKCVNAIKHIATLLKYGKIKRFQNDKNYIICEAYSIVISRECFYSSWQYVTQENSNDEEPFPPTSPIPFPHNLEDYLLINYYIGLLQDKECIKTIDSEFLNIEEYQTISKLLIQNWTLLESRIKENFFNLLELISGNDIAEAYNIDTLGNQIEAVDLGLPSGILWCSNNVYDASGYLYAWAESKSKNIFSWNNYFDCPNDFGKFKYINHNNAVFYDKENEDYSSIIEINAAKENFGPMWTIPSKSNWQELIDECKWEWTKNGNDLGYNVVGKSGNHIFLPVLNHVQGMGSYWSFNLNKKDSRYAEFLFFDKKRVTIKAAQRYLGLMIRPVATINNRGEEIDNRIGI